MAYPFGSGGARSRIANDWQTVRRHQRCDASRHQLESVTLVLGIVHGYVYIWLKCVTSHHSSLVVAPSLWHLGKASLCAAPSARPEAALRNKGRHLANGRHLAERA